ncbi:L,D-transpeptidase family protein [Clostridium grantii]|uniref:L,D-transpeptidase family protein n=1 Tax=Clostridium grantii TaxID=40575 RepID=UPI001FA8D04B|nr:L,D-transpeptidase family protein [Clostridium grantii]
MDIREDELCNEENHSGNSKELFFDKPENAISNVNIKVYKSERLLELYEGDKLIRRFKIALGTNAIGDKEKEGDKKTPEGEYYICTRNYKSKYTLSLGISYPNIKDAQNGLNEKLIDKSTFNDISQAINNKKRPPWNTTLGGEIMIHGGGNSKDWTWGCIALSDEDIRIIWDYVPNGTSISIYH